jgi:hypothetical protein
MARRRSGLRHLYLAQMRHYNLAPTAAPMLPSVMSTPAKAAPIDPFRKTARRAGRARGLRLGRPGRVRRGRAFAAPQRGKGCVNPAAQRSFAGLD